MNDASPEIGNGNPEGRSRLWADDAMVAANREEVDQILADSEYEFVTDHRARSWWPSEARCSATNFAALILGVDPNLWASLLLGHGPKIAQRLRSLLKRTLLSRACSDFMAARDFNFDVRVALETATTRVVRLAMDRKLVDWHLGRWND